MSLLSVYQRRCRITNRTLNAFRHIVFWIGMLLTIGGLCILLVNLLRH